MPGKFKTLGLVAAAVLAMSAMLASAAQAQFTTNAAPTTVTATSSLGNDVLVADGGALLECSTHFEGTASEVGEGSLTIKATYSNCKNGFGSGAWQMNGCDYVFHATGKFDIVCPAGKVITITANNCEMQIPGQTGLSKVNLTNHHPHIDAKAAISGMTVNRTKDGFLCPLSGTGHVSNATYNQAGAIHVAPVSGGTTISVD